MTRDITEGRSTRAIAVDLGVGTNAIWQNNGDAYDFAIAGIPFLAAINDVRPYERATAQFRKQQFDSQRDPGEQSLSNWWLRSQSSFHAGEGITFYDPLANPYSTTLSTHSYRYAASRGVELMDTQGEVTLLRRPALTQSTTTGYTIETVTVSGNDRILIQDGPTLKITDGTTSAMTTISAGVVTNIYASANDGINAYYVDGTNIIKTPLAGASTSIVRVHGLTVTSAAIGYVKQRLVVGINNAIYEMPTSSTSTAMVTAVYTHPNTSWVWTSITEGGSAIYAAGYAGANSAIYKFVLDTTTGAMPTLTSGIIAALVPDGEIIYSTYVHLMSYIMIGTNKGVRVGTIDNTTGNITYGPLMIATERPVRGFDARDAYVYVCSSFYNSVTNKNSPGIYRIDLSTEIDTLRFAYQTDVYPEDVLEGEAIDVCWLGTTKQLAFLCGAISNAVVNVGSLGLYVQSATQLYVNGYVETGQIRFNTLEKKHFERLTARGDFDIGSVNVQTVDIKQVTYDIIAYDISTGQPEVRITQPSGAQDSLALRFTLYRSADDSTLGPKFKGYQMKALPATPRNRIITVPLMNFDSETDKYNMTQGYEGRAFEKLTKLEAAEAEGDVVTFQDFRNGETFQCLIEEVKFTVLTPPDKKLTGFGGIISLTIRTV